MPAILCSVMLPPSLIGHAPIESDCLSQRSTPGSNSKVQYRTLTLSSFVDRANVANVAIKPTTTLSLNISIGMEYTKETILNLLPGLITSQPQILSPVPYTLE